MFLRLDVKLKALASIEEGVHHIASQEVKPIVYSTAPYSSQVTRGHHLSDYPLDFDGYFLIMFHPTP